MPVDANYPRNGRLRNASRPLSASLPKTGYSASARLWDARFLAFRFAPRQPLPSEEDARTHDHYQTAGLKREAAATTSLKGWQA